MVSGYLKGERVLSDQLAAGFCRHVTACQSAVLPGERLAFRIGEIVGWVRPEFARALMRLPGIVRAGAGLALTEPGELESIAVTLADKGFYRLRNEVFDVRAAAGGPILARIDRGAVPTFGIISVGAHVNGLVCRPDGLHIWIARRAADKLLDPGKLDHIVAGGVPSGLSARETLIKEAAEEAAIPAELARQAVAASTIAYKMERPEGLRRDYLHCYDLVLPETFVPRAADGEVAGFELWPLERAAETVGAGDDFKFNVNLVMIDLFIRRGLLGTDHASRLARALASGTVG